MSLTPHFSSQIWFKAKTINRGRSVLGCTFAHLIALKRFTTEDFDVMLEDNVRAPIESCADIVHQAREASISHHASSASETSNDGVECHFRFLGWLGSLTNLEYLLHTHREKRAHYVPLQTADNSENTTNSTATATPRDDDNDEKQQRVGVFPFPLLSHVAVDLDEPEEVPAISNNTATEEEGATTNQDDEEEEEETNNDNDKSSGMRHSRPGGNFIWGSYAYWISRTAYQRLLETLRNDVGALLWKGNRSRYYSVKPIDKVLPRQILKLCGPESVQISTHPAFFRAPMLTSKIHVKWDPEFCKSTEYQLKNTGLDWSNLWLSDAEQDAVKRRLASGSWALADDSTVLKDHF
jgi:hypothetical protein